MGDQDEGEWDSLLDPWGLWRTWGRPAVEAAWEKGVPSLPQAPLALLLEAVRGRLLGRTVTLTVADRPVSFVLDDVVVGPDPMLLASGQADDVRVTASSIRWGDLSIVSGRAVFHNVHTRPGQRPQLVSAPVDLVVVLATEQVAELLASRVPWLTMDDTRAGLGVRLARRPRWGSASVALVAEPHRVLVVPTAVARGGRRWDLPRRLPPVPIRLPLPAGTRLTDVVVVDEGVELHLRLDERRLDYREAMGRLAPSSRD